MRSAGCSTIPCTPRGWRSSITGASASSWRTCAPRGTSCRAFPSPTETRSRYKRLDAGSRGVTLPRMAVSPRKIFARGPSKYMGRIAVQLGERSLGGCMHRRFAVVTASLAGAFAAIVALPLVSACQRRASDTSCLATDAQPAAANPTTADTVKQVGPMPSLAPRVKQLRPVVVNINSRVKPRQGRVSQRMPQGHPRVRPPQQDDDNNGDDEDSQDPMERFFRYFGQSMPNEQERHGLGSGSLLGDGLVLTNNHVVEIQDESRPGRYRPMDEIKVITDETAPGGAREIAATVVGNDPKSDIAILKIEGKDVDKLKYADLGDSDALEVG